jgi:hypothetical protein
MSSEMLTEVAFGLEDHAVGVIAAALTARLQILSPQGKSASGRAQICRADIACTQTLHEILCVRS